MNFEQFAEPGFVRFLLDDEEFVIRLPTRWNKPYMRAWQSFLTERTNFSADGKVSTEQFDPFELQEAQMDAFAKHCMVESSIDPMELKSKFPALFEAIFQTGLAEAEKEEARAEQAVGKLQIISSGKPSGKVKQASTKSSKPQDA
jgi:hypothetical protein